MVMAISSVVWSTLGEEGGGGSGEDAHSLVAQGKADDNERRNEKREEEGAS